MKRRLLKRLVVFALSAAMVLGTCGTSLAATASDTSEVTEESAAVSDEDSTSDAAEAASASDTSEVTEESVAVSEEDSASETAEAAAASSQEETVSTSSLTYDTDGTTVLISTAAELIEFSETVSGGDADIDARLTNDIDVSGTSFAPIGDNTTYVNYEGTFDGDGYTVTLDMSGYTYAGLFSAVEDTGTVKNVTVEGAVTGTNGAGGIACYNYGTITDCINKATVTGRSAAGGITGYNYGTVISCGNEGTITAVHTDTSNSYATYAGGIAGTMGAIGNVKYVYNCYNWGDITASTATTSTSYRSAAGGIVGETASSTVSSTYNGNGYHNYIENCYSTGTITASHGNTTNPSEYTGGILGLMLAASSTYTYYIYTYLMNCRYLEDTADAAYNVYHTNHSDLVTVDDVESITSADYATLLTFLNTNADENSWTTWYADTDADNKPAFRISAPKGVSVTVALSDTDADGVTLEDVMQSYLSRMTYTYTLYEDGTAAAGESYTIYDASGSATGSGTTDATDGSFSLGVGETATFTSLSADSYYVTAGELSDAWTTAWSASASDETITIGETDDVSSGTSDTVTLSDDTDSSYTITFTNTNTYAAYDRALLYTADELVFFSEAVTDSIMPDAEVENDIDASESDLAPIGGELGVTSSSTTPSLYTGTFEGGGYTITVSIVQEDTSTFYSGLFGGLGEGGVIQNLTVDGTVSAGRRAGGVVAYAEGGTITNVTNKASVTAYYTSAANYVAGILGCGNATIKSCTNHGTITGSYRQAGGIVGHSTGAAITSCMNYGTIIAAGYAGGILGYAADSASSIEYCGNEGTITGTGSGAADIGGVAGCFYSVTSTINSCYNKGAVSGSTYCGGVIGYINSSGTSSITNCYNTADVTDGLGRAGGIVARISANAAGSAIENCYSSGMISCTASTAYIGGIVGYAASLTTAAGVSNCYMLTGTTGDTDVTIGYVSDDTSSYASAVSADVLKASASTMGAYDADTYGDDDYTGGEYMTDTAGINEGYPILWWEDISDTLSVVHVIPAIADDEGTILDSVNTYLSHLSFTFTLYKDGEAAASASYTVYDADGTASDTGTTGEDGSFTLYGGQSAVFTGLSLDDGEASYYVTEGELTDAWADTTTWTQASSVSGAVITESSGLTSGTVTVTGDENTADSVTFTCTNTYAEYSQALLYTVEELNAFSATVTEDEVSPDAEVKDNIDASAADSGFTPIGGMTSSTGTAPVYYTGTFNGGSYTITLAMDVSDAENKYYAGLFSGLGDGGVIQDLTVAGTITAYGYCGGVVGRAAGGTIKNVTNKATVTGTTSASVGGILGRATSDSDPVTITSCVNKGKVTAGTTHAGGILGYGYAAITGCINDGEVTSSATSYSNATYIGGIAGQFLSSDGDTTRYIKNCMNYGAISGSHYVGGIAGWNSYASIQYCGNQGTITGLFSDNNYVAGISGYDSRGTVDSCYNRGTVSGAAYSAGVVGFTTTSASVTNCYNNGTVSSENARAGGVVGQLNASATMKNCYNAGQVSSSSTATTIYVGSLVAYTTATSAAFTGDVSNNYALAGTADDLMGNWNDSYHTSDNMDWVTANVLNGTEDFAEGTTMLEQIGLYGQDGEYKSDTYTINTSYPVLWWEIGATITVSDDSAVLDYGLPVDIAILENDTVLVEDSDISYTLALQVASTATEEEDASEEDTSDEDSTDEESTYADSANGTYGTLTVTEGTDDSGNTTYVLTYTPTSQLTGIDTFSYQVTASGEGVSVSSESTTTGTVTIVPATSVYYEEDFGTEGLSTVTSSTTLGMINYSHGSRVWTTDTTGTAGTTYKQGTTSTSLADTYGSDAAYESDAYDSAGHAIGVTSDTSLYYQSNGAYLNYDFTGTGTTVYGRFAYDNALVKVQLYTYSTSTDDDGNETTTKKLTETKYLDTRNLAEKYGVSALSGTLYNTPLFDTEDFDAADDGELAYGHYMLRIYVYQAGMTVNGVQNSSGEYIDGTTLSGVDFYIDGVEVRNPLGTSTSDSTDYETASACYESDGESTATTVNLRDNVAENGVTGTFATLTTTSGNVTVTSEYDSYGPKRELYLYSSGSSDVDTVSFYILNWDSSESSSNKIYLAMKSPKDGGSATATVGTGSNTKSYTISHAMDLYYDITDYISTETVTLNVDSDGDGTADDTTTTTVGLVTISADSGLLSLTNIKLIGAELGDYTTIVTDDGESLTASVSASSMLYFLPTTTELIAEDVFADEDSTASGDSDAEDDADVIAEDDTDETADGSTDDAAAEDDTDATGDATADDSTDDAASEDDTNETGDATADGSTDDAAAQDNTDVTGDETADSSTDDATAEDDTDVTDDATADGSTDDAASEDDTDVTGDATADTDDAAVTDGESAADANADITQSSDTATAADSSAGTTDTDETADTDETLSVNKIRAVNKNGKTRLTITVSSNVSTVRINGKKAKYKKTNANGTRVYKITLQGNKRGKSVNVTLKSADTGKKEKSKIFIPAKLKTTVTYAADAQTATIVIKTSKDVKKVTVGDTQAARKKTKAGYRYTVTVSGANENDVYTITGYNKKGTAAAAVSAAAK